LFLEQADLLGEALDQSSRRVGASRRLLAGGAIKDLTLFLLFFAQDLLDLVQLSLRNQSYLVAVQLLQAL
jgi:hypothetical protein